MSENPASVSDRIQAVRDRLSPTQRKLAQYILDNHRNVAFMTTSQLADAAGVSESSVFRLSVTLGYSGFPALQESIQAMIREALTSTQAFTEPSETAPNAVYTQVFTAEAKNLGKVLASLSPASFDQTVELLFSGKHVLVAGHQSSAALASFAGYTLSKVRSGVTTVTDWNERIFATVYNLGPNDVAWVHVFPRYPTSTVRILDMLRERQVPTILVTNSVLSQLAHYATVLLPVSIRYDAFIDGMAPVMCLINSLILATALKDPAATRRHLAQFDEFVQKAAVFYLNQPRPENRESGLD